jgi:hypothetical protein
VQHIIGLPRGEADPENAFAWNDDRHIEEQHLVEDNANDECCWSLKAWLVTITFLLASAHQLLSYLLPIH